jgi:hypothetical protein
VWPAQPQRIKALAQQADTAHKNEEVAIEYILMKLQDHSPEWAIPDMQRKFVWKDAQIIKLLSSIYDGFPVGAILYWEKAAATSKAIGQTSKIKASEQLDLIIDGQQRLTSLKVIFEGIEVLRKKSRPSAVRIQFNPLLSPDESAARFEPLSKKGAPRPGWIDVLDVLTQINPNGKRERRTDLIGLIDEYRTRNSDLTPEEISKAQVSISRLNALYTYQIPAVKLLRNTSHAEAAEIFVRINSSGTKLDMADFIMTTLALNSESIKEHIHEFSESLPDSAIFEPEPIDLLAALIAFTFGLSAGSTAYELLKGKDPATGKYDDVLRKANLAKLESNISHVCNEQNWCQFLETVANAGICSKKYLNSESALISSYAIYLHLISKKDLREELKNNAISLWILFCTLTRRYSAHTDNQTRSDLHEFRNLKTAKEIIQKIYSIIDDKLPGESSYSSHYRESEYIVTICAAQRNTTTLFSHGNNLREAMRTSVKKSRLEEHHIFPKAYMEKMGYTPEEIDEKVDIMENLAPIASAENKKISDNSPVDYVINGTTGKNGATNHPIKDAFSKTEWKQMCDAYALPDEWWNLRYDEFVKKRAALIPAMIKSRFDSLRTLK